MNNLPGGGNQLKQIQIPSLVVLILPNLKPALSWSRILDSKKNLKAHLTVRKPAKNLKGLSWHSVTGLRRKLQILHLKPGQLPLHSPRSPPCRLFPILPFRRLRKHLPLWGDLLGSRSRSLLIDHFLKGILYLLLLVWKQVEIVFSVKLVG